MSHTVSVSPDRIEKWLANFWTRHGKGPVTKSENCVVAAGTDGASASMRLLWPGVEFGEDPLSDLIRASHSPHRLGLLVVRADGHAVGLWDGSGVTESKRRGHYVQSRTAAGGWSQQRFARRRENQAKAAYEKASGDVAAVIEPAVGNLDGIVAAGNPSAIKAVLADSRCRRTAALAAKLPLPHLELRDTSREALVDLASRLLAVVITIDGQE